MAPGKKSLRAGMTAAAIGLLACLAATVPSTANAAVTPPPATQPNSDWSGYSAAPVHGHLTLATASWKVPQVTCPKTGNPRAAVWVGMWGTDTSKAWLPQIGTQSLCVNGAATYSGVWQIFTAQTDPLCQSLVFAQNQILATIFCNAGTPITTISGFPVAANDQIRASVEFMGPYTRGSDYREFAFYIDNITQNKSWSTTLTTNRRVSLDAIASQGGAIVEDSPSCTLIHFFGCGRPSTNGLADFAVPIHVSDVNVAGGAGGYRYTDWLDALAFNGPLTIIHTGPSITEFQFDIKWVRQYLPMPF